MDKILKTEKSLTVEKLDELLRLIREAEKRVSAEIENAYRISNQEEKEFGETFRAARFQADKAIGLIKQAFREN